MKLYSDFEEGKTIVLPKGVLKELRDNKLTNLLMVTDIGFFSKAYNHHRERKKGSKQHILIYCVDGEGWFEVDQKREVLRKDEYIILLANTPHKYGSFNRNPWSIYWIHFTGTKAHHFINTPNQKIKLEETSTSRYQDRILLFEEIFNNLDMQFSKDNIEYANICLWHMLASFRYLSQYRRSNRFDSSDKVSSSIKFMRDHLSKKIALNDIASSVNLSVSQFSLLFKQKTSRTPIDYLLHLRIQQATKLLDFKMLRIKEISNQVGFSDPFYFSRVFSKIMGMSPKSYRKLKKG